MGPRTNKRGNLRIMKKLRSKLLKIYKYGGDREKKVGPKLRLCCNIFINKLRVRKVLFVNKGRKQKPRQYSSKGTAA
jgi:hypothetical protein